MTEKLLHHLVIDSAINNSSGLAIKAPDGSLTYKDLDQQANNVARKLLGRDVRRGDRVAIWSSKSCKAVVAMQAILRVGAAYVPIDPVSPSARAVAIIRDCGVNIIFTTKKRAEELSAAGLTDKSFILLDDEWIGTDGEAASTPVNELCASGDLAYILYTSGSTGKPKGVCLSHGNALAFVDWVVATFQPSRDDRFSNHAPFHFDLSVLDLYAAFSVGASVHVVSEEISYIPKKLTQFVEVENITIWYSVPSVLVLMMEYGNFLDAPALPIRTLFFAGEPFPIKYLRKIRERWPHLRLLNLYGPTETNVCTYFEVKEIDEARISPVPIGIPSCGDKAWIVSEKGTMITGPGEKGELMISGPTVMLGYWGQTQSELRDYATGDIVSLQDDGNLIYHGRKDSMFKIRGHRVEPGEIEAALLRMQLIAETAVLVKGSGLEAKLIAFIVCKSRKPTLIEVKEHCSKILPRYMIVDEMRIIEHIPKTGTGKTNRVELSALLNSEMDQKRD